MNKKARLRIKTSISGDKIIFSGKEVFFPFTFKDWNFRLEVTENKQRLFTAKLFFLNPPADLEGLKVHCNPGDNSACMSIHSNDELAIEKLLLRISHWVLNAGEIYNGLKKHDCGYRHGLAAFFEKICSDYGFIFCMQTFESLSDYYKKEMYLMAIEHDAYSKLTYESFLEKLQKLIQHEELRPK